MSTLTINASWTEFPGSATVPSGTFVPRTEDFARRWVVAKIISCVRRIAGNRILRLELLLATSVIGFGCFAWQTIAQESVLSQASAEQSRSIAALGEAVTKQTVRTAALSEEVVKISRDLAAQSGRISRQLEAQDKQMAAIESRLIQMERSLHYTAQSANRLAE
jgi:septal ring factor EnvC (AmiA/AmiB activator)